MGTPHPVTSTAFPIPLPHSLQYRGSWYKCNCSNFFHILLGERIFLLLKGISNPLAIPFISSAQWIWKNQPGSLFLSPTAVVEPTEHLWRGWELPLCATHTQALHRWGQHTTTHDSFINNQGQLLRNNDELKTYIFYFLELAARDVLVYLTKVKDFWYSWGSWAGKELKPGFQR